MNNNYADLQSNLGRHINQPPRTYSHEWTSLFAMAASGMASYGLARALYPNAPTSTIIFNAVLPCEMLTGFALVVAYARELAYRTHCMMGHDVTKPARHTFKRVAATGVIAGALLGGVVVAENEKELDGTAERQLQEFKRTHSSTADICRAMGWAPGTSNSITDGRPILCPSNLAP